MPDVTQENRTRRLARASLEWQLLGGASLLFACLGFMLFLAIRQNAIEAAEEAFDRVLGAAALSIADTVQYESGNVIVDIPYSAFAILGMSRLNRVFYRVVAPDGEIVTGSPILGLEIPHATGPELRVTTSTIRGEAVRIAAVGRFRSDAHSGQSGWVDVMVGETQEARTELARQLTFNAIGPLVLLAVLAFGMIWYSIRRAFQPLRALESSLRARARTDLSPIEANVPREIGTLVTTLNLFMERLDSTLEGLRRVTADAAHQLRTPLMAMRAQTEIALDETAPPKVRHRLERIHANAVSASVLANKLLADATLLHNLKAKHTERIDLRDTLKATITRIKAEDRFVRHAYTIKCDFPEASVLIEAEPTSLTEMLTNLVENALIHGQGEVRLVLKNVDQRAVLTINDQGPGIPLAERDLVFQRFFRGNKRAPGSGLGLSIAKDVVTAMHGDIRLDTGPDGRGLSVVISLPIVE